MENLIFLIIAALVFIFKIREGMKKYQEQRPERDENTSPAAPVVIRRNAPASPAAKPAQPPAPARSPRPAMSPRPVPDTLPRLFDELLGVDRPASDERELPMTNAAAAPPPTPPPVPRQSGAVAVPAERRRYLDDDDSGSIVASASAAMSLTPADLLAQNMAKAFPAAMRQVRALRPGVHAPIHVRVGGRSGLRHAVIMAEVLQRPRAYDL